MQGRSGAIPVGDKTLHKTIKSSISSLFFFFVLFFWPPVVVLGCFLSLQVSFSSYGGVQSTRIKVVERVGSVVIL